MNNLMIKNTDPPFRWYYWNEQHKERDLLPHLQFFAETFPSSKDAAVWRSQLFPDLCFPEFLLTIDEERCRRLVSAKRKYYKAVALWLDWLILGNTIQPNAFTDFELYQPFAEIEKLFYDLANAIYPRPEIPHGAPNSAELWENMRFIECMNWVHNSGALTGVTERNWATGKSSVIEARLKHLRACNDFISDPSSQTLQLIGRNEDPGEGFAVLEWEQNPRAFLIQIATLIASTDKRFESGTWKTFRTDYRRLNREIDQLDYIACPILFRTGEIFFSEKGKKIPKSKLRPKGFGKNAM